MTNLESIFKSRDITVPTKVHPVKAMVFPVIIMVTRVNWFERVRNRAAYLFVFSYFLCNGKQNFPLCVLLGIF